MTPEEKYAEQLPGSLLDELKKTDRAQPLITAKVDRAMATLVREQFSSRAEQRRRSAPAWLAVAATVLLAILLIPGHDDSGSNAVLMHTDVDHSGQIDIADVFALARRGSSTRADLDAFAMQIVALGNGGDSS